MNRKQKKALSLIIIAAVLTLAVYLTFLFVDSPWWVKLIVYAVPYFVVGYKVLWDAFRGILKGQVFDEKFLMSIATIGAFVLGEYPEAVMVMLFYQVGELFQSIAVGKSRKSISAMMKLRPDEGVVLKDGAEVITPLEEVQVGDVLRVLPGEQIPLDGVITVGNTQIDTSALTGESLPKEAVVGDAVIGGCLNISGAIELKVTAPFEESTLSKILDLVENTSAKKAKTEKFISKFAKYYTPIVVISALLVAVIPPLFIGIKDWSVWQDWIRRALIFLVVSCPCALVISVPLTFFSAIGSASKKGILVKGASYLETLSKTKTVVFDKTGTLTQGVFGVTKISAVNCTEDDLLQTVASAESLSLHPIARSIVQKAEGLSIDKPTSVTEEAGFGVIAEVNGKNVLVGNSKLLKKHAVDFAETEDIGTVVYVAKDGVYQGFLVINDLIKDSSLQLVKALKEVGVEKTAMLTGDSQKVAKAVAERVGIDEVYAELLPQDKLEKFEEISKNTDKNRAVAFVGDGVNDAPVLMRADVGIAMGGYGSDVAIESADVVLMKDRPTDIAIGIKIARKAMRICYQNIIFALGVKFAVLVLSLFGVANMLLAIFADVGVCVLAILNAMRAYRLSK